MSTCGRAVPRASQRSRAEGGFCRSGVARPGGGRGPEPAEGQTVLVAEVGTCASSRPADGETEARGGARSCLGGARHRPRCARGNRGSAPFRLVACPPTGRACSFVPGGGGQVAAAAAGQSGEPRLGRLRPVPQPPREQSQSREWRGGQRTAEEEKGRYWSWQPGDPGEVGGGQSCLAMSYQKELVCGDWPSVVPATEDRSFKCSFSSGKSQWPHVASGCLWSGTAPATLNHLQTGGLQARKGFSVWSGPYAIFQCFTRQYPRSQKIRKLKIPDTLGKQFPDVAVSWS